MSLSARIKKLQGGNKPLDFKQVAEVTKQSKVDLEKQRISEAKAEQIAGLQKYKTQKQIDLGAKDPYAESRQSEIKKTIKQKFDIDVDKRGKPFQIGETLKESKLSDEQKKEFAKLLVEYETLSLENDPAKQFLVSATKGYSPVSNTTMEEKYLDDPTRYRESLSTPVAKAGGVVGNLLKYASLYGIGGGAIAGAPMSTAGGVAGASGTLLPSLSQRVAYAMGTGAAGTFASELAKDVVIGGAVGATEAVTSGQDVSKTVATNIAQDIVFNAILGVGGKAVKSLADAMGFAKKTEVVEQVAKEMNVSIEEAKKVIDDVIYVNQFGVANTKPFDQLQLEAPKTQFKPTSSDAFGSTLRQGRTPKSDFYTNQFGTTGTKPFEQLQLEAPRNINSDAIGMNLRPEGFTRTPKPQFKGDLSLTQRKFADLGDRKVKAFQFENPEVQPFYKEKAKELIDDAKYTKRGSYDSTLVFDGNEVVNRFGDPRITSPTIARIINETGETYEKIIKSLEDIVNDKGAENHATAKRIENILDDMLTNGYRNFAGDDISPNAGYIALRNRLDETKIPLPGEKPQLENQLNQQMQMGIDNQQSVFDIGADDDWMNLGVKSKPQQSPIQPIETAPPIQRPSEFAVRQPQYPPLAKDFARETVTPKITPLKIAPTRPLQDISINKPSYPSLDPKFAKEVPRTVLPSEIPLSKRVAQKMNQVENQPVTKGIVEEIKGTTETAKPFAESNVPYETPMTGSSLGKFYETASKSEQTTIPLKERIKSAELGTTTNEARLEFANKIVDETPEDALTLVLSGDKFTSDMEGAIGNVLYGKLQEAGRYEDAFNVIEALSRKARKSGQEIQILSLWSKTTPEGMARWAARTLEDAKVDVDPKFIAEISDDIKRTQELTTEELSELLTNRIKNKQEREFVDGFMKSQGNDYLKELNVALTMKKVMEKLPIASARKLSTIQSMSHLLNAKTFARNILGNTTSISMEQISKLPASVMDRFVSLFTGNRGIVAKAPRWQQSMTNAWKEGRRSASEILLGVNRVTDGKHDLFFESAFKDVGLGKLGRAGEKALSLSLNTPDEFFKGFVKADSVYNQVRARLGKEVDNMDFGEILNKATPEEIKYAIEEARFATFQNDSLPAKLLTDTKKLLNRIGYGKTTPSGIKEFGLGDLVVKYTRVPGNLIARGIEYSPLGYAKMLSFAGKPMTAQAQREFSQIFGRATTGVGLGVLGFNLAKAGLIEPIEDLTYDEMALARSEGRGSYKINVSGLIRLIQGKDPKKQQGDTLKSYDWIQPLNIPIAVGAQIHSMKGEEVNTEDVTRAFASATMEQALDLPTMYIIQSMINESRNSEADFFTVASVPLLQALPGFVPSPVRQTAQFLDPVIRDTKGANLQETTKKKILANIPFASEKLEPKLSPLGKEQLREGGFFGSLISPATTTTYNPSKFTEGLSKVKELTGLTNFYPDRQAPKKFDYRIKGEKTTIELTPQEKTLYQKTYGEEVQRLFSIILTPISYSSESRASATASKLSDAESKAREKAKDAILKKRGLK